MEHGVHDEFFLRYIRFKTRLYWPNLHGVVLREQKQIWSGVYRRL
ncbi:hypothetical protein VO64_5242 [Pseudomonas synxantha]|uniref:Mobile element protein n=1 Tax=Pseudomonas synxantha TaxID=47883 RepID=A0AAU8TTB2_9PSED|nr:hypothetical protein VO64_5242 [Pseudomonas synxantha]